MKNICVFVLYDEGKLFHSTYTMRANAQHVADNTNGEVKDFGVIISNIDPIKNFVSKWSKTDGYSVWL